MLKFSAKIILFGALLLLFFLPQACRKRTVVIPDACVKADKTEIKINDTVTFTDCSQAAENVQISVYKTSDRVPDPDHFGVFDAHGQYKIIFSDTGSYTALQRAINNEVPIQEYKVLVTVRK